MIPAIVHPLIREFDLEPEDVGAVLANDVATAQVF